MSIILCKIAHGTQISEMDDDENAEFVLYGGINWKPLEFLSTAVLRKLIREFVLHEIYSPTFNLVTYKDNDCPDDRYYMGVQYSENSLYLNASNTNCFSLFSLLYKNFDESTHLRNSILSSINGMDVNDNRISSITSKLYDALYEKHLMTSNTENPDEYKSLQFQLPDNFKPKLCNFQMRTVKWLLKREHKAPSIPMFFTKLEARDNEHFMYKHHFYNYMQQEAPENEFIKLPPGGILADEMGLGKTVEMLALILLHQRIEISPFVLNDKAEVTDKSTDEKQQQKLYCICNSNVKKKLIQCSDCKLWQHENCVCRYNSQHEDVVNKPYACPSCWKKYSEKKLFETGATFIVSPNTIKTQWLSEIKRHIQPHIRVLLYDGVRNDNWISPRQLADYDVVLTDYNVLRGDVYHTSSNDSNRVLRHKPRSMRVHSPLLMLNWWRVCLDEAQIVESNISKVSALVRLLPAINRWAVTGTPIQRSMEDLRSLLDFIGFKELSHTRIILDTLTRNFIATYKSPNIPALVDVLHHCMWRTCKSHIIQELQLPPQSEIVHRVQMRNLEKLFYFEQHANCEADFNKNVERRFKYSSSTGNLTFTSQVLDAVLYPLIRIRQCCTVSVVSGSKQQSVPVTQKQFLNPKELHKHLKSENEQECKSFLRTIASSYNGMAGIYFLEGKYDECIKNYRLVLKLAQDYNKGAITVDSLLQIHALHNILEAYAASNGTIPETQLNRELIEKYEVDCHVLEWKFKEPYAAQMHKTKAAFDAANEKLKTEVDLLQFLGSLVQEITTDEQLSQTLLEKLIDECWFFTNNAKLEEINSISSVLYVISIWYGKVRNVQKNIEMDMKTLEFYTANIRPRKEIKLKTYIDMTEFVRSVYNCHLSEIRFDKEKNDFFKPLKKKRRTNYCKLCGIERELNKLECLLFNKTVNKETHTCAGDDNPSMEIYIVKLIFNFVKIKSKFQSFVKDIDLQLEVLEAMQTACKKLLKYWIEIEYSVKAHDELDMCKMRISLTDDEDEITNFKIQPHQMDFMLKQQETNLQTAQMEFVKKLARLKYIMHLEENSDPGVCPICHTEDDSKYVVLECGHHICLNCLKTMYEYSRQLILTCSICRNRQSLHKIYLVTREIEKGDIPVNGNYSSKIIYIVRLIKKLLIENATDPKSLKILIFSQWVQILNVISMALEENDITYRDKFSPKTIDEFKNSSLNITCLLMPLQKGSKGLNLIEATHVFLVEPILNPAEELQAIGRVHRFGQKKPTTVHRFIVLNTIEENVFNVVKAGKESQENYEFDTKSMDSVRQLFNLKNDVPHFLNFE